MRCFISRCSILFRKTFRCISSSNRFSPQPVALFVSYNGANYYGLQYQPVLATVEGVIFDALLKSGAITYENYTEPWTMGWERASRTDKGVSAACQILSCRLYMKESLECRINTYLPPDIRIQGIIPTVPSFEAYAWATFRSYSYILPTYVFTYCDESVIDPRGYRISQSRFHRLQRIVNNYVGINYYKNLQSDRQRKGDATFYRMMNRCFASSPYLYKGQEFLTITIRGQAFMLNQIRKMISWLLIIVRAIAPESYFNQAFSLKKISIPTAPPNGLYLERIYYEGYNKLYYNHEIYSKLDTSGFESGIEHFRQHGIIEKILEDEFKHLHFIQFLPRLLEFSPIAHVNPTPTQLFQARRKLYYKNFKESSNEAVLIAN